MYDKVPPLPTFNVPLTIQSPLQVAVNATGLLVQALTEVGPLIWQVTVLH
jgi:hypothetical protein